MFYTHLNLYGLKIEEVIVSDGHANEAINVGLKFRNIRSEEHPALFIKLYSKSSIIGGNIFCIDSNGLSSEILVYFPNRGRYLFDRIEISTLFPLKLFKAFIYFDFNIEVIVYPELVTGFKLGDIYSLTHSKEDLDVEIRNYRLGDQINRIAWKKSFENNLRTKIEVGQDDTAILFYVGFDDTKDVEEEIKLTATSIKACFDQNRSFGVKTKDQTISIDVPNLLHVKKCLNLLAVYES
jgi:hypothetical protein